MKRHPALQRLSREHHAALVLAKRAQRLGSDPAEIAQAFAVELEPHFLAEESGLLLAMEAAGQAALTERTVADHQKLRELAHRIAAGDAPSLPRFGHLLEAHIRFEERELFPCAESILPPELLARIDRGGDSQPSEDFCRVSHSDRQCPPPAGEFFPTPGSR